MSNLHATTDAVKRDGRWLDLMPASQASPLGSITNVDRDGAIFRNNELELVSRTGIEPASAEAPDPADYFGVVA